MNNKKLIRENFRNAVFTRDNFTCVFCGKTENLDAHHITDRNEIINSGYVMENGITLCPDCHKKAEIYHNSNKTVWYPGFHPDDLYQKIDSSYELAYKKSKITLDN